VVVDVPTVVATEGSARGRRVAAIGEEARRMIGRTPAGIQVIRPVRGGVISDFEATEHLLRHLLAEAGGRAVRGPRVLVCVPTGTTEVERRAVQESTRAAGAREVQLVPSALAAAIGAELPVSLPVGSLMVDIGGGRTDVAVTSLGGIVARRSVQVAGDELDAAIVSWARRNHGVLLGEATAERLKIHIGGVGRVQRKQMRVRGRDLGGGAPKELELTTDDISHALQDVVAQIRSAITTALKETPPELSADILDRGMMLAGGSSALRGLGQLLREDTDLPVLRPEEPAHCVVRGAARMLEDLELFELVAATN